MSHPIIDQYYNNLERAVQFGKSRNEETIKSFFWILLNSYAYKFNYEVVREVYCMGTKGRKVKPDGILKNFFGLDIGYWESKDEKDNIDDEIDAKQKKGYPFNNILFEDSQMAALFQRGEEIMRADMHNPDKLHAIITKFITYKSETVYKFEEALEKFKADIPAILDNLRGRIDEADAVNESFRAARDSFLQLCRAEINPDITKDDVREMMIQHILTSDIFNKIFDDPEFHRHNNIARELEKLNEILFSYSERRNMLTNIEHYYDAINSAAAAIADHHEKQKFLKVLYENFYKVYNPKAADRLGVVYTPNEIVQFMIESADYLLHKHFGKTLADPNVEILDPAAGTGTFISSIIDHIDQRRLTYKYQHELHANEVAILPYYIANLNIEFTYKQKMGQYEEFKNLCFVDTLDNIAALDYAGKQRTLFGLSSENAERIRRQNSKKISVIIGNPPYNAKQANYNYQNSNRAYVDIDKRIKETYVRYGTAQNQIVVYDMYTRFYRWAMDRVEKNGIIAFITNRSFIDSRALDGFRKCIQNDFTHCYIIDTKSDVRINPKISGTTHNVFGIQIGVAIVFLVRKEKSDGFCRIEYFAMDDFWRREEKLEWLRNSKFERISFKNILPDKNNNWINLADNDFDDLLPLIDKKVKAGRSEQAVFRLFSRGICSQRDEWVYDLSRVALEEKVKYMIEVYSHTLLDTDFPDRGKIKWDEDLSNYLSRNIEKTFNQDQIVSGIYRPFFKNFFYLDKHFNGRTYQWFNIFIKDRNDNLYLGINVGSTSFIAYCSDAILSMGSLLVGGGSTQCLPLYRYDNGKRTDNITDWGLVQFHQHYQDETISKEAIFHYTYAVLHNPAYRKKYALNLKREFPRLPFYENFWQWAEWGKALMDLHINYEQAAPYALQRHEFDVKAEAKRQIAAQPQVQEAGVEFERRLRVKVRLKADKERGLIELDELTYLSGIPKEAWEYKLGNRSALEWVLDQYKEKKPSEPTIAEKFNTYRFTDYKEKVIDLLQRVCTVSIETMKIIKEMEINTK